MEGKVASNKVTAEEKKTNKSSTYLFENENTNTKQNSFFPSLGGGGCSDIKSLNVDVVGKKKSEYLMGGVSLVY